MKSAETEVKQKPRCSRWVVAMVWLFRVAIGAVFIMSGLVKAIDIWGVVFKFEDYFTVWGVSVPNSLTVLGAMALSSAEFILGGLLLFGCFRRTAVWGLLAMMAVMLPLTFYVWVADPVSDCGCFGDFIILSNGATFAKNIAITAMLVFLARYNRRASCIYHPYSQWLCGVASLGFITFVELYGYNVQPMVDFRSFPVGSVLVESEAGDDEEPEFLFVYEKDGAQRRFQADSLPDSTWVFVDREVVGGAAADGGRERTELTVYDSDGEDVTEDVVAGEGIELLVVVPEQERADLYYTSFINELTEMMTGIDGSLVEITDIPLDSIESWRDFSMAEFPIYRAEGTVLKELARGVVSIVMIEDGVIRWKRNMGSVDVEAVVRSENPRESLERLAPDGVGALRRGAVFFLIVLLGLLAVDKIFCLIFIRKKDGEAENKCVNLQKQSDESKRPESLPEAVKPDPENPQGDGDAD